MSQFKNLVFEGGGVKGIAYAGALKALEELKILQDIHRVAGTSAGAITAAYLALGFNTEYISNRLKNTNMKAFMDDRFGILRDLWNLTKHFGWYRGDKFIDWIKEPIKAATYHADLTFESLNEIATKDPEKFKNLYIIVTNLSKQREEICSAEHTPSMPIWLAVRMSMSIPLFFEAVKYNKDLYVDGGVSWNYPIDIFDDQKYDEKKEMTTREDTGKIYNTGTLGLRVGTLEEISSVRNGKGIHKQIGGLKEYGGALVEYMLHTSNRIHLHKLDRHRTIFLNSLDVGTTEFGLSDKRSEQLIASGYKCAQEYFKWFEKKTSRPRNKKNQ